MNKQKSKGASYEKTPQHTINNNMTRNEQQLISEAYSEILESKNNKSKKPATTKKLPNMSLKQKDQNIKISRPTIDTITTKTTTKTYEVKVAGFTFTYIDRFDIDGDRIDYRLQDKDGRDVPVDSPKFGDYTVGELIYFIQWLV